MMTSDKSSFFVPEIETMNRLTHEYRHIYILKTQLYTHKSHTHTHTPQKKEHEREEESEMDAIQTETQNVPRTWK